MNDGHLSSDRRPEETRDPKRPSGRWSLRTRLALALGCAIAAVGGGTTYVQSRVVERTLESELVEAARLTALAVADDVQLRPTPYEPETIRDVLHGFSEAMPELGSLSVITADAGTVVLVASTSTSPQPDTVAAGRRAIETQQPVWVEPTGSLRILAQPLWRGGKPFGAVTVTVSFDALARLRNRGRAIALWSMMVSVGALFVLIEWLVRYFIHRPVGTILTTVRSVSQGHLSARVPALLDDELGVVADGLNRMLGELESLQAGLQLRVDDATAALRDRNRELLGMYQEMFTLREQLGRTQQLAAVGETASAVAHQIGTPLNLASGHLQLLMDEEGPTSPTTRRLQLADEQIGKVTAIVRDLLARSRRPLVREQVDPRQLLGRLCTLVAPAMETSGVALVFEPADVPTISADATQLELALLNLVSNALDAMAGGGQLTIRLEPGESRVRIVVADTGTGVPPELVARVFEPWVTTKPPGRGTGLGLGIARAVVVDHGGTLSLTSTPGAGTTVVVDLPAAPSDAKDPAHHA
jgi:two-component system, NtrC family, sensor kinase